MAGKLPGVKSARRRRLHGSGGWSDSLTGDYGYPRRFSFCLRKTNNKHESHLCSKTSSDENLGGAVREAKKRLDERLRAQWNSEPKRVNGLREVLFGQKKKGMNGSKRFNWANLGMKASDPDECAVCLEWFKAGQTLVHLPCTHRFHSSCLVPWLQTTPHCPCCRMLIPFFS